MDHSDYVICVISYDPLGFLSGDQHPLANIPEWDRVKDKENYRDHIYLVTPERADNAFLPVVKHYGVGLLECVELPDEPTQQQLRDAAVNRCLETNNLFIFEDDVVMKPMQNAAFLFAYCYGIVISAQRGFYLGGYVEELLCARNHNTYIIKSKEY